MKSKLFLLIAVCGMMLMSCQDNTPECYYHKKVFDLKVMSPDWKFDSVSSQFYYRFELPEITSAVYNYGNWNVYREYLGETKKDDYQVALPLSLFKNDTIREEVIDYYTQYIDYRIGVGYVDIQLTNSDYLYGPQKPEAMSFRLQANEEIIDLTVPQADWNFDEQTDQYYCRILVPEITSEIYNHGNFTVCREFNKGTTDAYQVQLPMSMFLSEIVPVESVVYYTQHIDSRVGVGYLDVQLTNSDYLYDAEEGKILNPESMLFRLVLTY
jgi:hypothetical protein